MRRRQCIFGIQAKPPRMLAAVLYALPFLIVLAIYHVASAEYLAGNPGGKILPSFAMMGARLWDMAFTLDTRSHTYLLWADTLASLTRLMIGLSLAALAGLIVGMNMAIFPGLQYLVLPGIVVLSFVPMLAVLPILLIVLGIEEIAKVTLIFLGVVFFITRDVYAATREIPRELLVKARTLGASELALVYRIALPMVMPRLLETLRQSLGPAWLFLIAGEGIAAREGLGYRIYLVRRTSDFTAAIPYVLWITALAFCIYYLLLFVQHRLYAWKV